MIRRHIENIVLFLVLLAFVLQATGCTSYTVVKLAEMCQSVEKGFDVTLSSSLSKIKCQ